EGMGSLPEALARGLGTRIVPAVAVKRITHLPARRFLVDTPCGAIACDGVVVATPAWQAPRLLEPLSKELAAGLADVAHTALDCVTLAWPRADVPHALDGTGWVAAPNHRRPTLPCTPSRRKR